MHDTALLTGQHFFDAYGNHLKPGDRILDIGSMDVNGSLRSCAPPDVDYIGMDISPGKGVDVVLPNPYASWPFPEGHFKMIVSTSCFEHDKCFWLTFTRALPLLDWDGVLYISAPSNGVYHAYPQDCWRFYPDAGLALLEYAWLEGATGLELIESFIAPPSKDGWEDNVMVFSFINDWVWRIHENLPGCRDVRTSLSKKG